MVKILRTNIKNDENNTRVNLFYLLCFLVFFLVFIKIYLKKKKIMTKKRRSKHLITLIVIIFGLVRFL
jgi:membrane-associated HD superfamily phosphohydrolase